MGQGRLEPVGDRYGAGLLTRQLKTDRRGATALEFGLCFPAVLLGVFGLFALYSLIVCKRAMEYGVEKALRYAAVNSAVSTQAVVTTQYNTAAGALWKDVGLHSTVTVTPATFKRGDTVSVSVTYAWVAPIVLKGSVSSTLFDPRDARFRWLDARDELISRANEKGRIAPPLRLPCAGGAADQMRRRPPISIRPASPASITAPDAGSGTGAGAAPAACPIWTLSMKATPSPAIWSVMRSKLLPEKPK